MIICAASASALGYGLFGGGNNYNGYGGGYGNGYGGEKNWI